MITSLNQLDPNARYTYADYYSWTFRERVELIKGKISPLHPGPGTRHQYISGRLVCGIGTYIQKNTSAEILNAPLDVRLMDGQTSQKDEDIYTVVQPDIIISKDKSIFDERGVIGTPDWLIEIVIPNTARKDLKDKFLLYEENGVKEYWIVFPFENVVRTYFLDASGHFKVFGVYTAGDVLTSYLYPDLNLQMDEVFDDWLFKDWDPTKYVYL